MGLTGLLGAGVGAKGACGGGSVNSKHRTGVEGSSHLCTKGYHPKYGFLF